jgi:S-layer homology domain
MRLRLIAMAVALLSVMNVAPAGAAVGGFDDVNPSDYFATPVKWMSDEGITAGTSPTTFSPDVEVSRGVAATFLWRMKGSPAVGERHGFADVTLSWQDDPISWLAANGITTGTSPSTFEPNDSITRAEFAVMLWRLDGRPTVSSVHPFTDVTAPWQNDAISWMSTSGITTGTTATTFSPDAAINRGQAATFLYRYAGSPTVSLPPVAPVCSETGTSNLPSTAGRQVVDASGFTGTVVLDEPDTVYDFKNVAAGRDITIAADRVEARNIRGTGARRIGRRDGNDYVDSGFRNFEFTYISTENGDGGDIIRPYFVNGVDMNPDNNVGSGSPAHIYAYEGDIIEPLLDGMLIRGWIADPNASDPHNDGVQITGISGGRVFDPTIRNSTIYSGSAFAVLARHTYGRFTIEGSTFFRRYTAFFAVMGDARDVSPVVEILWRNNDLNGSDAIFRSGYEFVSGSCGLSGVTAE